MAELTAPIQPHLYQQKAETIINGKYFSGYVKNLNERLLDAQKQFEGPKKNATNPFLKNSYADLGSVIEAVKQTLLNKGIIVEQECVGQGDWMHVKTHLICPQTNELKTWNVSVRMKEISPQGSMGAFTYGRRYGLKAGFFMVDEDDDANEASGFEIPGANKKSEKKDEPKDTKGALSALLSKGDIYGKTQGK